MSNNESFIDEVTEEVRRERLYGLLRRWGWVGVVAVLAIVGGAAWFEWQRAQATGQAQAQGDALLAALESDDAVAALGGVSAEGDAEAVRLLLVAGQQEAGGDAAAALATLETVAGLAGTDPLLGDLARIKSLMLATDMAAADRLAGLEALSRPGAAYRMPALEQMALVQVGMGDTAAARETLAVIIEDAGVPQGMRARAEALVEALGGSETAASE